MDQVAPQDYVEAANRGEFSSTFPATFPGAAIYANQASLVFAGAGTLQLLAAWHAATANRNLWLRRAWYTLVSNSGAATIDVELVRITAAPTGGTAVTPFAFNKGWAPEANGLTAMKLGTGGGTVDGVLAAHSFGAGVFTAGVNPGALAPFVLGDYWPSEGLELPRARKLFLEGFMLQVTASAATTLKVTAGLDVGES